MYIHAYQSLVWNEIASRRVKDHGLNLLEGDLVYVTSSAPQEVIEEDEAVDESGETAGDEEDTKTVEMESKFKTMVKQLTATDIESNSHSIFDIVLPLPGHDITYPGGNISQWYEERLAKDDLSSEKLKQKHKYV